MTRVIRLQNYTTSTHQLTFAISIDDLRFHVSLWFPQCNLLQLDAVYGTEYMEKVYFHIAAFEMNRFASTHASHIEFGKLEQHNTENFRNLWKTIFVRVWSQWRYLHNLPCYTGPTFTGEPSQNVVPAVLVREVVDEALTFCGGGKDSLACLKLLEEGGVSFDSLAYSRSVYGQSGYQHRLIDQVLDHADPKRRLQIFEYDDFSDSPIFTVDERYKQFSLLEGETPSSVFAAIPYVLTYGYQYLLVGNERSADYANLWWPEHCEFVNHQWGKSLEAEQLLNRYVREELISNCEYCSLLKCVHDPVIFSFLEKHVAALRFTHSCNVAKPWCGSCPKCVYVLASFCAYLPKEAWVAQPEVVFHENLRGLWEAMLGRTDHTPFECIGGPDEVALLLVLAKSKQLPGNIFDLVDDDVSLASIQQLLSVDQSHSLLPRELEERILPHLRNASDRLFQDISFKELPCTH